jgi:hypothetical protein
LDPVNGGVVYDCLPFKNHCFFLRNHLPQTDCQDWWTILIKASRPPTTWTRHCNGRDPSQFK